jgi:hypothetical protein
MRTLSEYARGRKKSGSKRTAAELRYGSINLPKKFQFICTPDNGEREAPRVPKKFSQYYMTLNDQRMIVDIEFLQGPNAYCVEQIQQAFSHLSLNVWRFYSVDGRSLTDVTGVCNFETFDLETLGSYNPLLHTLILGSQVEILSMGL